MKKRDELTDPTSCLSKAGDDELVFVLRAHDPAASRAIRAWVLARVELGKNTITDPQIQSALADADRMDAERLNGVVVQTIGEQPT